MLHGELIAGRYRLEAPLGQGGMKMVWRAEDLQGGGPVALAVLFDFDPDRFLHEVALARRVQHRHVARVLDARIDGGRACVISELCDGPDLERLRRDRPVSVADAVRYAHEMTLGLVAIHQAHVLHRDVKPSNAILTREGVKVIDFGVSLPAADHKTGVGGGVPAAGTLAYMAPECFGGAMDARADTYALGVSLYQLVTGSLPRVAASPFELIQRLHAGEPLPLDAIGEPRVRGLLARLCAMEVEARPYLAEVEAELGALAAALAGEQTVVGPPFVPSPAPPQPTLIPAPAPRPRVAPTRVATVPVRIPEPGRLVIGWPHAPLLALMPHGARTRVVGHGVDGSERWAALVDDALVGGLVADLDGDGVGELYAWSERQLVGLDAAGRLRLQVALPPPPPEVPLAPDPTGRHALHRSRPPGAPMPWDRGSPAPLVLDGFGGVRELAVAGLVVDVVDGVHRPLADRYQGSGAELVATAGAAGLSCHGSARQCFRGDLASPAAILARRRAPGFVVASLERDFASAGPSIVLGLYGPGGRRVGAGVVGTYDFKTAPIALYLEAQQPETRLFPPEVAPLAVLGPAPAADVVIVPYLTSAPWFGPVVVAFDGAGRERWRERVQAFGFDVPRAPLLCDLTGDGEPELVWTDGRALQRRVARTGAVRPAIESPAVPVAVADLSGRGEPSLIAWRPDRLELHPAGPCLPGAVGWLPGRGDLWRSGTLGVDGLPVGPRA